MTMSMSLMPTNGAMMPADAVDEEVATQDLGRAADPEPHAAQRDRDQAPR